MSTSDRLTDEDPRVTLADAITDALCDDAWEGHEDPLTLADIERIAAVSARAALAARLAAQPPATDRDALGMAWDDGNATGLDGWVGPGRGTEPDPEGIDARERYLDRVLAARPAPDTLADRVQALIADTTVFGDLVGDISAAVEGKVAAWPDGNLVRVQRAYATGIAEAAAEVVRTHLRALLAGRSDASPEGGA